MKNIGINNARDYGEGALRIEFYSEEKKLEAARDLYQKGNYSAALKLYLDMVNASYSYKLYYEIGRCYYRLNDFDKAVSVGKVLIHRGKAYVCNAVNLLEL